MGRMILGSLEVVALVLVLVHLSSTTCNASTLSCWIPWPPKMCFWLVAGADGLNHCTAQVEITGKYQDARVERYDVEACIDPAGVLLEWRRINAKVTHIRMAKKSPFRPGGSDQLDRRRVQVATAGNPWTRLQLSTRHCPDLLWPNRSLRQCILPDLEALLPVRPAQHRARPALPLHHGMARPVQRRG